MERFFFGLSAMLLLATGVCWWISEPTSNALSLVENVVDIGDLPEGIKREFSITVRNQSGQDWRVVGIFDEPC